MAAREFAVAYSDFELVTRLAAFLFDLFGFAAILCLFGWREVYLPSVQEALVVFAGYLNPFGVVAAAVVLVVCFARNYNLAGNIAVAGKQP